MKKLLIIDDEENMRHMLKALIERHGYQVSSAEDGAEGIRRIKQETYDFILCDVKMPKMDGMAFLAEGRELLGDTTVIMMSAYGSIDSAIAAMQAGAYDFISKPFKSDEVLLALKKAEEREALKLENARLKEEIAMYQTPGSFGSMIGESQCMKDVFQVASKIAGYHANVLITGESGTGKELVARGIHKSSDRGGTPLIAVNCGSIPESLIESELFGHIKGAFTGADYNKQGLFEQADKSTLFLDEIGELPLEMQVKLLRVLQEREIKPVGSTKTRNVDVRVLAATARDLQHDVRDGKFREDLFYRLNVIHIKVPPLRNRKEDIPLLCNHFIKKFNNKFGAHVSAISAEVLEVLYNHNWPGNVRELENAIQRGIVMTDTDTVEVDHLPEKIRSVDTGSACYEEERSLKAAQKKLEKSMITKILTETSGNKSKAAQVLEISYPSLLSKIKEYNIQIES